MSDNKKVLTSENYYITVNQAEEVDYYAAKELNKYILSSTGENIEINPNAAYGKNEIIIGGDYIKDADSDGFYVEADETIRIKGDNARGTLYGVYDFLEKFFGIRFLTRDYTYIPRRACPIIEKISYRSVPDFRLRTYLFVGMEGEFSAKVRMYNEVFPTPSYCGGSIKWNCTYAQNHNMLYYVQPDVYYTEENKEQNKRMFCLDEKGNPVDVCCTDGLTEAGEKDKSVETSVFGITLEKLKKLLTDDKDSVYFPVEQMDTLIACGCERCKKAEEKYRRSGMNVRFANALSRELKKWLKEQGIERKFYLVIFAYNYSLNPPVKWENGKYVPLDDSVVAEDNVVVRIAPIKENCYYPMQSNMHFIPIEKQIEGWKTVCKNIMVWTYHTNFKCFLWYFPTMQHWQRDAVFLKENNTFYNFMQSNHMEKTDWKSEMELYVASKILWDVNSDVFAVRNEFIDLFYGVAAPYVKEIIFDFEENYKRIAEDSEKLRKEFFLKVNGVDLQEAYENVHDIEKLEEMLSAEAKEEWTHNVYFSLYHKEIMWAKVWPLNLLEKQLRLIFEAKEKVALCDCSAEDKERIVRGLEKIELSVRFMILYNFSSYYGDKDKTECKEGFLNLCDKFGYKTIGEVNISSFSDFVDKGCDLC